MPPTAGWRVSTLTATLLLLTLTGCSDPDYAVDVRICGDLEIPQQVDSLRVTLLDDDRTTRDEGVVEFLTCPSGQVRNLPIALSFAPIEGRAYAQVKGLKEGEEVVRMEKQMELSRESDASVRLPLTQACLGVLSCPLGQTCVQGECRVAPPADRNLRCQSNKPTGTMPDAGSTDTSSMDVSTRDTGVSPDSDVSDTGTDSEEFDPRTLCPNYDPGNDADIPDDVTDDGSANRD